jgi:hypothetical protein
MAEMCCFKDRSLSKMTPRLRVESEGVRMVPSKVIEDAMSFARCWCVPIMRYSVLEGLTERRLEMSQS